MSGLCGVWYLADSKHWRKYLDEYQKVIGIDLLHKKKSNVRSDRICEILNKGDEWIIKTPSSLRSKEQLKFIDGKEFEENIVKNQKIKCIIRKEGDKKLIEFQKDYITGNKRKIIQS